MPMTEHILNTVWSWIHDQDKAFYCVLAKENDHAIGLIHYREMPSPLRGCSVGFLDDLFVLPEHRGSGVVQKLYACLKAEAAKMDWPLVRWITQENNYRGRGVYDKVANKTSWITYQLDI